MLTSCAENVLCLGTRIVAQGEATASRSRRHCRGAIPLAHTANITLLQGNYRRVIGSIRKAHAYSIT
jgi:hypothetical protein